MSKARYFDTGATRDTDEGKLDFEGFLSPVVLRRYAEYMHVHRFQSDGEVRPADNWTKGIPQEAYMKSMARHFFAVWENQRVLVASPNWGQFQEDQEQVENDLCALLFNVMGLLYEHLRDP